MPQRPNKVLRALIKTTEPLWGLYYKRTLERLVDPFPRLMQWIDELKNFPVQHVLREIKKAARLKRCRAKTLSELLPYLESLAIAEKYTLVLPFVIGGAEQAGETANLLNRFLRLIEDPQGNPVEVPRLELYVRCTRFNWPVLIKAIAKELNLTQKEVRNDLMDELREEERERAFTDTTIELKVVKSMIIRYGINLAHLLRAHGISEGTREPTPLNTIN